MQGWARRGNAWQMPPLNFAPKPNPKFVRISGFGGTVLSEVGHATGQFCSA